jgi:hypothetical protein
MSAYQVLPNGVIQRTDSDGSVWCIPPAHDNLDYQRFLADQVAVPPDELAAQLADAKAAQAPLSDAGTIVTDLAALTAPPVV